MAQREGFEIRIEELAGITKVSLIGGVDSYSADALKRRVGPICERPDAKVLIDFRDTTYLNSSSIGQLNQLNRACSSNGGTFVACAVDSKIMAIMEILGLHKTLTLRDTCDEGLSLLGYVEEPAEPVEPTDQE